MWRRNTFSLSLNPLQHGGDFYQKLIYVVVNNYIESSVNILKDQKISWLLIRSDSLLEGKETNKKLTLSSNNNEVVKGLLFSQATTTIIIIIHSKFFPSCCFQSLKTGLEKNRMRGLSLVTKDCNQLHQ